MARPDNTNRGSDGDEEPRRSMLAKAAWTIFCLLALAGAVFGLGRLREQVIERSYSGPNGQAVVHVTKVPSWMPVSLASRVSDDITPPDANLSDEQLARHVYERAESNPLVARATRVEVRPHEGRPGGVVEVDLEFRQPLARINYPGGCVYVDETGVCMPAALVPVYVVLVRDSPDGQVRQECYQALGEIRKEWRDAARRIHYVTIDGVAQKPPKDGVKFQSPDLQAALELIKLIRCRPYYAQIAVIDVRNFGCRISQNEPELRMVAQIGQGRATDIRFGRLPRSAADCVVSPRRKIWYLDDYADNHNGLLAGINSYLDLRYDYLHVSLN